MRFSPEEYYARPIRKYFISRHLFPGRITSRMSFFQSGADKHRSGTTE